MCAITWFWIHDVVVIVMRWGSIEKWICWRGSVNARREIHSGRTLGWKRKSQNVPLFFLSLFSFLFSFRDPFFRRDVVSVPLEDVVRRYCFDLATRAFKTSIAFVSPLAVNRTFLSAE